MTGTVADLIVATLRESGVRRVYGLPGDSLNGFTDALRRDGSIDWMHCRHEESAAFAAGAEAAMTGEIAVCAASCGPGNLHFINGLFEANRNRVPVLAIASHIPSEEIGSEYFQETHPQELFRECSVYREMVGVPAQMPRILQIAMRTAIERSGVAVLVIPGEVFFEDVPSAAGARPVRAVAKMIRPPAESLDAAAEVLNSASDITILAGAGCAGAHEQVMELAAALQAPIVHALRGKEHLEYDNRFDVGMTGLLGFGSGYRAMEHCQALLLLGTDFPYQAFYPSDVPVIQVDIRGEHIGRRVPVDIPLVGTVKDTAEALLPLLKPKSDSSHLDRMTAHYRRARAGLDKLAERSGGRSPLHPEFIVAAVSRLAADDAVFAVDVGTPTIWAARYLQMNGRRRMIGSFNHGTMASAMPQAIGVQACQPGRQVVSLCGDGGLAMLLGDLLTLRQLQLPVKVVVLNNGALSFVELEMKAAGIVNYGTDLMNPDFAGIAQATGIFGVRVENESQLEEALQDAFSRDGPALVDVRTDRYELSLPPKLSYGEIKGFTLYATRTILSGGGKELIELGKTNLRQLEQE
ncbi:MAG TPA: ubiquinone-dependent pyruvate dehydrogenase [Streptosporangiaceae bacterium]|nr:ubiquinone-dependent pyruvate dehydrogenase [Streptosporangiaceae bacterium]